MPKAHVVPLIPRTALFGTPERRSPTISPDGTRLAYLSRLDGSFNVWVGDRHDLSHSERVTHEEGLAIHSYSWAYTNRHIVYIKDWQGDENWQVHCVDLVTGATTRLTPMSGV